MLLILGQICEFTFFGILIMWLYDRCLSIDFIGFEKFKVSIWVNFLGGFRWCIFEFNLRYMKEYSSLRRDSVTPSQEFLM
jgi:hypothetical protein